MAQQEYDLTINAEIRNKEYDLTINAEICNNSMGDRLHISETMTIRAESLLDVMAALTRFHELAESLRAAKASQK